MFLIGPSPWWRITVLRWLRKPFSFKINCNTKQVATLPPHAQSYQFPDRKKTLQVPPTFPDKFAANKLNKCIKFINKSHWTCLGHGFKPISKMFTVTFPTNVHLGDKNSIRSTLKKLCCAKFSRLHKFPKFSRLFCKFPDISTIPHLLLPRQNNENDCTIQVHTSHV